MLSSTRMGMGLCLFVALGSAAALIGWDIPLLWRIIAVALLIISIGTGVRIFDQEKMRQQQRLIQAASRQAVDILNHQRHDWMNDLQLLYGYVRLNKLDKLPQCVEQIKLRMEEESRIAKLGYSELILFLMQLRLSGSTMPIEVHIPEAIELSKLKLSLSSDELMDMIAKSVMIFRTAPKPQDSYECYAALRLSLIRQEDQFIVRYEYGGKLLRPDDVKYQYEQMATERGVRLEQLSNKEQDANGDFPVLQWMLPCMTE
ncbi:Spo0B domain-containing protein [Paenibacillus marinisediminis]